MKMKRILPEFDGSGSLLIGIPIYIMALLLFAFPLNLCAQVDVVSPYRLVINVDGYNMELPYERSHPLDTYDAGIDRGIVVCHGSSRNSDDYYARMLTAASMEIPDQSPNTIIIAPQFLIEDDINYHSLGPEILFWSSGWRQGHKSLDTVGNPRPARISSFGVIDFILDKFADNSVFPNLSHIVVIGHSAGGQVVQRYAAGSQKETELAYTGILFRYIVANPSSYVYFNGERRIAGFLDQFEIPADTCSGTYNEYRYGLEDLNSYMTGTGIPTILAQYPVRDVVYLLGDQDTGSSGLDVTCPANLEGIHRYERGTIFFNYIQYFFSSEILDYQSKVIVPGVGHSSTAMFQSVEGRGVTFEAFTPIHDWRLH
jgi:hypothetical protein